MKTKRNVGINTRYAAVAAAVVISMTMSGCNIGGKKDDVTTAEKPVAVSAAAVEKGTSRNIRTVIGKVKPAQEIGVFTKIPGKVEKVYVDIGQQVKKGQILFALDEKDIKLQVSQAEAAYNVAKANLDRTKGGAMELQLSQLETSLKTAELNLNDASRKTQLLLRHK